MDSFNLDSVMGLKSGMIALDFDSGLLKAAVQTLV